MIFSSFEYVGFFVVLLGLRALLHRPGADKWLLLIASYAFYMSWSVPCGALLLALSFMDYGVGLGLERVEAPGRRRALLLVSIAANLGVLAYFKYTNFILDNLGRLAGGLGFSVTPFHHDILLPAGISFFTFQSMTYTIEAYRRNLRTCHSPRDFLLFVAFFPQLLAGPINRAADLLPQFRERARAHARDFETGLVRFGLGAVKKLVISDQIAPSVDLIFARPQMYDRVTLVLGLMGYAVQIYCDFSGYTDMAIGSARMMGFRFMENFQMPYSAVNITEFWRRWHISLSGWFRDYVYIPLGGNRRGVGRTYVNLFLTMLLCGLWHGASWNFVFWGAWHGMALATHKLWQSLGWGRRLGQVQGAAWFGAVVSRVLTLATVLFGWVFFRGVSWGDAWTYVGRLVHTDASGIRLAAPQLLLGIATVAMVHLVVNKDRNWTDELPERSPLARVLAYSSLILALVCFAATDTAPFIYFQF